MNTIPITTTEEPSKTVPFAKFVEIGYPLAIHSHFNHRRMLKPTPKPTRANLQRMLLDARDLIGKSINEMVAARKQTFSSDADMHQNEAHSFGCEAQAKLEQFNQGAKL